MSNLRPFRFNCENCSVTLGISCLMTSSQSPRWGLSVSPASWQFEEKRMDIITMQTVWFNKNMFLKSKNTEAISLNSLIYFIPPSHCELNETNLRCFFAFNQLFNLVDFQQSTLPCGPCINLQKIVSDTFVSFDTIYLSLTLQVKQNQVHQLFAFRQLVNIVIDLKNAL